MANQPKQYKKFLVGAASAALVASAVAPVASAAETKNFPDVSEKNSHKDAIYALVEKGIIGGYEDGTFGPNNDLSRSDVVKMMGKWLVSLGHEIPADYKTKQRFDDISLSTADELLKFSALVHDQGVFNGSHGNLLPSDNITRENMALVLVRAFDTVNETNLVDFVEGQEFDEKVTDKAEAKAEAHAYIDVLDFFQITNVAEFNPKDSTTRAQFASFLNRTIGIELPETEATVASVSAANSTSLKVTGTGLNNLKAEDITVENNTVKSVIASADGKSATVTLNAQLVPDVVTKVTVDGKSYDVTYAIVATTIALDEETYDDDTKNQFLTIKVDGKSVTAQELINAGYSLDFKAFNSKAATAGVNAELFGSSTSTTGELATDLATKFTIPTSGLDLFVNVTLTKGSEVFTSPLTKITIKNLNLAADSISNHTLLNADTGFNQSSTTLVTGETASFSNVTVKAGAEEEKVTTGYSVKSSNDAVISVGANNVLTAQGPGTATVTVTYGKATLTKTFTVSNTARTETSISTNKTAVTLTQAATSKATASIKLLDQYGDAMAITGGTNVKVEESNTAIAGAVLGNSASVTGAAALTFTAKAAGSGTSIVTFRDAAKVKIGNTAVTATVTDNDTLAKYSSAVDESPVVASINTVFNLTLKDEEISRDAILDLQSDKYVKINIAGLNSAGVNVSAPKTDTADYNVTVNQSSAGVLAATPVLKANGYILVEAGTLAGDATITITNATDNKVVTTHKVSVTDVGVNVTGTVFKNVPSPTYATTLNYEDFLTHTAGNGDPVITGITLTKANAQPIRLAITSGAGVRGDLYIDKNADGIYDSNDVKVGTSTLTTTGSIAAGNSFAVTSGVALNSGDNGTVLFKVIDKVGKVVGTQSVKVDF